MKRFATLFVLSFAFASFAGAQTPPAQKAKFIPPVKGVASIEVLQTPPKRVGKDMVTVLKVRNMSKGSINLLKADEYWYDTKSKVVSGAPYAHTRAPILPGEVVEITLRSPYNAQMKQNQIDLLAREREDRRQGCEGVQVGVTQSEKRMQ